MPKTKAPRRRVVNDVPDPKTIGPGPGRMTPTKKKSLILRGAPHQKLKIVTEFWIDPRAPHIPGRIQIRLSDLDWYFTDDPPSVGLAPYGGNSGGADLRQTILLGVDGASAANRVAFHGCEITVLE